MKATFSTSVFCTAIIVSSFSLCAMEEKKEGSEARENRIRRMLQLQQLSGQVKKKYSNPELEQYIKNVVGHSSCGIKELHQFLQEKCSVSGPIEDALVIGFSVAPCAKIDHGLAVNCATLLNTAKELDDFNWQHALLAQDQLGNTVMHYASLLDDLGILQNFLELGGSPFVRNKMGHDVITMSQNTKISSNGKRALNCIAEHFIEQLDGEAKNLSGVENFCSASEALVEAVRIGNVNLVKKVLQCGGKEYINTVSQKHKSRPLWLALDSSLVSAPVVRALLDAGADPMLKELEAQGYENDTPFKLAHAFWYNKQNEGNEQLTDVYLKIIKQMVNHSQACREQYIKTKSYNSHKGDEKKPLGSSHSRLAAVRQRLRAKNNSQFSINNNEVPQETPVILKTKKEEEKQQCDDLNFLPKALSECDFDKVKQILDGQDDFIVNGTKLGDLTLLDFAKQYYKRSLEVNQQDIQVFAFELCKYLKKRVEAEKKNKIAAQLPAEGFAHEPEKLFDLVTADDAQELVQYLRLAKQSGYDVDLNIYNEGGMTLLLHAISNCKFNTIQPLIALGADVTKTGRQGSVVQGNTPLDITVTLIEKCLERQNFALAQQLVNTSAYLRSVATIGLGIAVDQENELRVKQYLDAGGDPYTKEMLGLHDAGTIRSFARGAIAQIFEEREAVLDPVILKQQENSNRLRISLDYLAIAASKGYESIGTLLQSQGMFKSHEEILILLLNAGLHRLLPIEKLLGEIKKLDKKDLDLVAAVNIKDQKDLTPLMYAQLYPARESKYLTEWLLENGANSLATHKDGGYSAMDIAGKIHKGDNQFLMRKHMLRLMKDEKIDFSKLLETMTTKEKGMLELVCYSIPALLQEGLQLGFEKNCTDCAGQTPLMLAVLLHNIDMVNILVKAGANIFVKDTRGQTALDIARDQLVKQQQDPLFHAPSKLIVECLEKYQKSFALQYNKKIARELTANYERFVDAAQKGFENLCQIWAQEKSQDPTPTDALIFITILASKGVAVPITLLWEQAIEKNQIDWRKLANFYDDATKCNLLHSAVVLAEPNIIRTLLQYGVNPNSKDLLGVSSLEKSFLLSDEQRAIVLSTFNLFFNELIEIEKDQSMKKYLAYFDSFKDMFFETARFGDVSLLEKIAKEVGQDRVKKWLSIKKDKTGQTVLMAAAETGNLPMVQALLARGASISDKCITGETAVDIAQKNNHEAVVSFLMKESQQRKEKNEEEEKKQADANAASLIAAQTQEEKEVQRRERKRAKKRRQKQKKAALKQKEKEVEARRLKEAQEAQERKAKEAEEKARREQAEYQAAKVQLQQAKRALEQEQKRQEKLKIVLKSNFQKLEKRLKDKSEKQQEDCDTVLTSLKKELETKKRIKEKQENENKKKQAQEKIVLLMKKYQQRKSISQWKKFLQLKAKNEAQVEKFRILSLRLTKVVKNKKKPLKERLEYLSTLQTVSEENDNELIRSMALSTIKNWSNFYLKDDLCDLARSGDQEQIKHCFENGVHPSLLTAAWHAAQESNQKEICQYLLQEGAKNHTCVKDWLAQDGGELFVQSLCGHNELVCAEYRKIVKNRRLNPRAQSFVPQVVQEDEGMQQPVVQYDTPQTVQSDSAQQEYNPAPGYVSQADYYKLYQQNLRLQQQLQQQTQGQQPLAYAYNGMAPGYQQLGYGYPGISQQP